MPTKIERLDFGRRGRRVFWVSVWVDGRGAAHVQGARMVSIGSCGKGAQGLAFLGQQVVRNPHYGQMKLSKSGFNEPSGIKQLG